MSSNAIGAFAVICVSGFAGCAATARATPAAPVATPAPHVRAIEAPGVSARGDVATPREAVRIYVARADDFRRR